jgi:hypothetical protein
VAISKTIMLQFVLPYPETSNALEKWYEDIKAAKGKSFTEVKRHLILLIVLAMINMYLKLKEIVTGSLR